MKTDKEWPHRPGTVRLGVAPDGNLVAQSGEDLIAIDIGATNRLIAAEARMLRRRGRVTGDTEPAPLAESTDGMLTLGHLQYRLVRRDRDRPSTGIYSQLWTLAHVAEYCGLSPDAFQSLLDAPAPVVTHPGPKGQNLYEATEVRAWQAGRRDAAAPGR